MSQAITILGSIIVAVNANIKVSHLGLKRS